MASALNYVNQTQAYDKDRDEVLSHVFGAVDKTRSSFSAHGKIGKISSSSSS